MNDVKIYQMIGICQKAGKLVSGEFSVKQAVLESKAQIVIVTEDASNNTKKLFIDKCNYRGIKCIIWGERQKLGSILGKNERVVIAVLDEKLSEKLCEMIGEIH